MIHPKSPFAAIPAWDAAFQEACDLILVYGVSFQDWHPALDPATARYIWQEAERLLFVY